MKNARHPRLRIATALIVLALCLVPATAYLRAQHRIARQTAATFDERTDGYTSQLQSQLESYSAVLYSMAGLFAVGSVDATSWERFVASQALKNRYPGIEAIAYAKLVSQEEAAAYEQHMQNTSGKPDLFLNPKKKSGDYVAVSLYNEISSGSSGQSLLGLDLAGKEPDRDSLETPWKTDGIAVVTPMQLTTSKSTGFFILIPISNIGGMRSVEKPFGYAVVMFDINGLVNASMRNGFKQKMSARIDDITDSRPVTIFEKRNPTSQRTISRSVVMKVGSQKWRVSFTAPSASMLTTVDRMAPNVMVAWSITIIVLIGAVVHIYRLRRQLRTRLQDPR